MRNSEIELDESVHCFHGGRDSYGRQVRPGTYMMTRPGAKPVQVLVTEDELSGELAFACEVDGATVSQLLDQCARDVVFSRIDARTAESISAAESMLESIRQLMNGIDEARRVLTDLERELAGLLGCEVGDGSEAAEAVQSYVRDGMGTPYDLLQRFVAR
jgi:hypothetical protein